MSRTVFLFILVGGFVASVFPGCRCASGSEQNQTDNIENENGNETETTGDEWVDGVLPEAVTQIEGAEPREGGEITVHIHTEPPSLCTARHSDLMATRVTKHKIYEMLLRVDPYDHPDYNFQPELAEALPEISEDGLVHTLRLRQGVKWHDGEEFNADDVIASYDVIRHEETLTDHMNSYLEELDSYEKIDDHTIRFTWKRPYFLALDVYELVPIMPEHVLSTCEGADFNEATTNPLMRHPVGTGPWKFIEWESHERIVVERFDDYWGDKPHLEKITFRIIEDSNVPVQLAERGELDIVTRIPSAEWADMDSQYIKDNYHRSRFQENNYAWIGWNMERPFFSDKRVRQALTMLVDKEGIMGSILQGLPLPTNCHFYAPRAECDFEHEPWPYDPVRATRLLDEAGWTDSNNDGTRDKDGVEFSFTFMLPSSSREAGQWLTKIKEDFERAGVDLNIQRVEWAIFTRRLREHDFDACTLLWGDTSPRTDPNQIWHSSSAEGGSNYVSFKNDRVDEIIEQARVTLDDDARLALYREFGQILQEEQPYTWMYSRPRLSLVHTRLRGVRESLGWYVFRDWWIADES